MMTTNYYDKDDDVDPNLDWNTERKILQTVVAIAVDGAAWTLDSAHSKGLHCPPPSPHLALSFSLLGGRGGRDGGVLEVFFVFIVLS